MNFRSAPSQSFPQLDTSFENKLRGLVDRIIRMCQDGLDIANVDENSKRKHAPFILKTNKWMSDEVFNLGCDLQKRFGNIDFRAWGFWMTCCEMDYRHEAITFRFSSQFRADHASRYFAADLAKYFDKPIKFLDDDNLRKRLYDIDESVARLTYSGIEA